MNIDVPSGSRPAARVLVFDIDSRLLLLNAVRRDDGHVFWLAPGGGVDERESFEAAALRELWEETGLIVELGPCVWTRRHVYVWGGQARDQYERYFVARTGKTEVCAPNPDSYIRGHRWWTVAEITAAAEEFAPRRIHELLPPLLRGEYPAAPLDCGV